MIYIFLDICFIADNYTRTCGVLSSIVNGTSNSGPNKLKVIFQTNRNRQNGGFMMVVTCVSPDFGNRDGCTQDVRLSLQAPSPSDGAERMTTETKLVTPYTDPTFIHFIVLISYYSHSMYSIHNCCGWEYIEFVFQGLQHHIMTTCV